MKRNTLALLLGACLSLSLLTACADDETAVPETQPSEPIRVRVIREEKDYTQDLNQCRQALENIRSQPAISILENHRNRGDDIVNGSTNVFYSRVDEDICRSVSIPMTGILDGIPVFEDSRRYLRYQGEYFNDDVVDGYMITTDTAYERHWGRSSYSQEQNEALLSAPWLLRFAWEEDKIFPISSLTENGQKAVRLLIREPFAAEAEGESYTVEFFFQGEALNRVEIDAIYTRSWTDGMGQPGSTRFDVSITEQVRSTDAALLRQEMDGEYETVQADIENRPAD